MPNSRLEDLPVIPATRFWNCRVLVGGFAIVLALGLAGCRDVTPVSGAITSDATWDPAGNPYVMTDDVTVSEGVTLTLLPGVVVKADSVLCELIVLGTLVANGTAEQPIVLTSYKDDTAHGDTNGDGSATAPAFGDWVGVGFAASSPGGIGDFVEIRHTGYYAETGTNFALPESDVDLRVRIACMRCHQFPEPEILPRELWEAQLVTMDGIVTTLPAELGGSSIGFSLREVVEWYNTKSAEVFSLPRSITESGPPPIQFRKRTIPVGPEGIPAIATLTRLEPGLFGDRDFVLSAVDMGNGNVYLISTSEGPQLIGGTGHPVRSIPGDLNGDGLTDLLVSDLGFMGLSDELKGRVLVALQLPDGSFDFQPIFDGVGRLADARPMDLDLDGDLDVVAGSFGWRLTGGIYLLYNETKAGGPLKFRSETLVARAGAVSVIPLPPREPDAGPGFAVAFAQHHEYISAFYPKAGETTEKAKGGAAKGLVYEEQVLYRAPHPNWGMSNLEVVDLDGDSDLDFLLAHGDTLDDGFAFKPYQGVMWLENIGGHFEPHRIGALYGAHRAEAADFDGDGDLDVVTAGFLPQLTQPIPKGHMRVDSIIWFERTADDWLAWSVEINHPRHTGVTVLDFDRDGRPDIVAPVNNAWEIEDHEGGAALEVWFNRAAR